MHLIKFNYKNKAFYATFALQTQFNDNWLKSVNMKPELVTSATWIASGRSSYPDRHLMVGAYHNQSTHAADVTDNNDDEYVTYECF